MRYHEFLTEVENTTQQEQLTLRALGMAAACWRSEGLGITQPTVAVLSSSEVSPLDRSYTVLATHTRGETHRPYYPLVRLSADLQPPLSSHDFFEGEFDQGISDRLVSMDVVGDLSKAPERIWYLEGDSNSLVIGGQPTYPRDVLDVFHKIF
jgi:hypothetical protein